MTGPVKFTLIENTDPSNWPCDVCGDTPEQTAVVAEVVDGEFSGMRCCPKCLARGDVNRTMSEHAQNLEVAASELNELVGRLVVPTYAEWEAAENAA